jgi:hypothetical protein
MPLTFIIKGLAEKNRSPQLSTKMTMDDQKAGGSARD